MALTKKSSITDLPFIMAGIFSIAVVAFLVTVVVTNLDNEVQDNEIFNTNAQEASEKMADDFPAVMDGGIIFIFFCLVFISLILASLVPIHPIFIPFYFLEYVLLLWVSAGIANAYQKVAEISLFASTANQFGFTIFFFHYFPYAIGFAGAILAIVMYKVKKSFVEG